MFIISFYTVFYKRFIKIFIGGKSVGLYKYLQCVRIATIFFFMLRYNRKQSLLKYLKGLGNRENVGQAERKRLYCIS